MPKYTVTFTKTESYDVEANNACEAEDMALDYYNNDKEAFTDGPIDEITVQEIAEPKNTNGKTCASIVRYVIETFINTPQGEEFIDKRIHNDWKGFFEYLEKALQSIEKE